MNMSSCLPFKFNNPFKKDSKIAPTVSTFSRVHEIEEDSPSIVRMNRSRSSSELDAFSFFQLCGPEERSSTPMPIFNAVNHFFSTVPVLPPNEINRFIEKPVNIKEKAIEFAKYLKEHPEVLNFENNRMDKSIFGSRSTSTSPITPLSLSPIGSESDLKEGLKLFTVIKTEKDHLILLLNTNLKGESKTELGIGSYARVRLGYNVQESCFVAVKKQTKHIKKTINEFKIMSKVPNLNVDRAITLDGNGNKKLYLFTEVMEKDFFTYLEESYPVNTKEKALEKVNYFKLLVEKLVSIHEAGIVHRDIKPENFLLSEDKVEITDFGFSSEGEKIVRAGTIHFLAPEVVNCQISGAPSDVWSMGATFYEVLTGRVLAGIDDEEMNSISIFADSNYLDNSLELLQLAVSRSMKGQCLSHFSRQENTELIKILSNCLKINPNDRLTAVELSEQLESFLTGT